MASSPPHPTMVQDAGSLAALATRLANERRLAIDTEAASFHRYVDRVYLLQLTSDGETALVDPLAVPDLRPIGRLLADPAVEVIFHDADYDLRILDRDYGFRARRLWDTKVAAQLSGEVAFGLGALLEKYFGVRLSKALQRADWSQRPLTDAMIAYAAADTAHLPELRDRLDARLREGSRLAWAEEEFVRLEAVRWTEKAPAGEQFLAIKGARALKAAELAVLRTVWEWREQTAADLDSAPFRVLSNEALVALARAAPTTSDGLAAVPRLPASVARRHGASLLSAVATGRATPPADWPRVERRPRARRDPEADARFQRLRELRARRAPEVGLDPGLVCPNAVLQELARLAPQAPEDLDGVPDLRRWQREVLTDAAVLKAVR